MIYISHQPSSNDPCQYYPFTSAWYCRAVDDVSDSLLSSDMHSPTKSILHTGEQTEFDCYVTDYILNSLAPDGSDG